MDYLNKKSVLVTGGLATLLGLAVYSKIENSKKIENLKAVNKNTIIDYLIEDTIKTYKNDGIIKKRLTPFTYYK